MLEIFALFTMMIFLNYLTGCMFYFKVKEENNLSNPDTQALLNLSDKYVILQEGNSVNHLYDIEIKNDLMTGKIEPLTPAHEKHLNPKKKGGNRYIKKSESGVVNEVHLFVNDVDLKDQSNESVSFPLSAVQKVQIYKADGGATAASWLLPPLIVIGVIAAIIAASSCPFLYTFDGNSYILAGEIYGGATYQSLERHDYLKLPGFNATEGKYQLKIANELKEIQYTNLCELIRVQHPIGTKVLLDKYGKIQTSVSPQFPKTATTLNQQDVTSVVREMDNRFFAFDDRGGEHHVNGLVLTFINSDNSDEGKLTVRAKNSVWADYTYGKFTNLFGTYYERWNDQQKGLSTRKIKKNALDQDVPLSIYLETKKGWKFIDYFEVVGPLAFREMVIPIDLSKAESRVIHIKLETGFMFWELDYAAMDFSENIHMDYTSLPLIAAEDEIGNDVKSVLLRDDDLYLIQPDVGNEVILNYASPSDETGRDQNSQISLFFHSKGYYERIRQYSNDPDWLTLITHKHKHAFSKYSWNEFEKAKEQKFASIKN